MTLTFCQEYIRYAAERGIVLGLFRICGSVRGGNLITDITRLGEAIKRIRETAMSNASSAEIPRLRAAIDNIRDVISSHSNVDTLSYSIKSIRDALLANWEKEHLPEIHRFRNSVAQGIPIPVLSICGKGTQEIRWTKYLSYFLNPVAKHGLGDRLVRAIIDGRMGKLISPLGPYRVKNVDNEVYIGKIQGDGCRCDIVIETDQFTLFIEQKIFSGEGNSSESGLGQLDKYTKVISESEKYNSLPCYKIYLTPNGVVPPKNIHDWIPMRHSDIVKCGIELLREGKLGQVAWSNLYRLLIDLAMGPVDQIEEELDELIQLADKLVANGFELNLFARYRRLMDQNSAFIQIIREGLVWQS